MTPDDSARNRKMRNMMSLNCSICLMLIFGVGKVYRIWTPKDGPPQYNYYAACAGVHVVTLSKEELPLLLFSDPADVPDLSPWALWNVLSWLPLAEARVSAVSFLSLWTKLIARSKICCSTSSQEFHPRNWRAASH